MLSILLPFSERLEEPIIVFCYCCSLVFVLFPDTISRQRTPSWIRSVVSFFHFHSMKMRRRHTRDTHAFPWVQWNITKQSHWINLQKVYIFFSHSPSVYLCWSRHCICVCACCCVYYVRFSMKWIELKKNRSTESEMNAEGMLRCKHCKHFLFQFSMYEYVLMACLRYSMMIQTHTHTETEWCASSSSSSTIFIFHFHSFLAPSGSVCRSIRRSTLCVCVQWKVVEFLIDHDLDICLIPPLLLISAHFPYTYQ